LTLTGTKPNKNLIYLFLKRPVDEMKTHVKKNMVLQMYFTIKGGPAICCLGQCFFSALEFSILLSTSPNTILTFCGNHFNFHYLCPGAEILIKRNKRKRNPTEDSLSTLTEELDNILFFHELRGNSVMTKLVVIHA
jgi:hypothetical protein